MIAVARKERLRRFGVGDFIDDIGRWLRLAYGNPTDEDIAISDFMRITKKRGMVKAYLVCHDILPDEINLRLPFRVIRELYFVLEIPSKTRELFLEIMIMLYSTGDIVSNLDRIMERYYFDPYRRSLLEYLEAIWKKIRLNKLYNRQRDYYRDAMIRRISNTFNRTDPEDDLDIRIRLIKIATELADNRQHFISIVETYDLTKLQLSMVIDRIHIKSSYNPDEFTDLARELVQLLNNS